MVINMFFVVFIIGIGIAALIWVETGDTKENTNNITEELYATQEYAYIRNLLVDCTLVSNDFSTVYFKIEQGDYPKGFFHFSFRFQNLEKRVIASQRFALEAIETHIKEQYRTELNYSSANILDLHFEISALKTA